MIVPSQWELLILPGTAFFQASPVRFVENMWMVTVVLSLPAVRLDWVC
jgi:hypothetical protein